MSRFYFRPLIIVGLMNMAAFLELPSVSQAGLTVESGWDLMKTLPGTNFMGVDFTGVPLGTYDFGGSIGVKNVDVTDTIIHRLEQATAPSSEIDAQFGALQLVTTAPTDAFGGPLDFYYVTLQSIHGGPVSTGTLTIDFNMPEPPGPPPTQPVDGSFVSSFDLFFDIRMGSLSGPIVYSAECPIIGSGEWSHYPPDRPVVEIPGVNVFLNGVDRGADFFPIGVIYEMLPGAGVHVVDTAPEPSTIVLLSVGAISMLAYGWRRRR